jgi:hypothetical protein
MSFLPEAGGNRLRAQAMAVGANEAAMPRVWAKPDPIARQVREIGRAVHQQRVTDRSLQVDTSNDRLFLRVKIAASAVTAERMALTAVWADVDCRFRPCGTVFGRLDVGPLRAGVALPGSVGA